MSQTISCAICGGEINSDASFCKFCGSPVKQVDEVLESAAKLEQQSAPTCPQCGAPIKNQAQKFCGSCGAVLGSTASSAPVNQTVAVGGTAPVTVAGTGSFESTSNSAEGASRASSPSVDSIKNGFSDISSKLDSFMGATVDLDAVGSDFDPATIDLSKVSEEELAKAFSYFGMSLNSAAPEEQEAVISPEKRRSSEEDEDKAPVTKEQRDFSAKAGATVFGTLSSQLHVEFAPKVEMIAEQRGKAANKEKVDRLKHKVELGDMDKRTAVDKAKE